MMKVEIEESENEGSTSTSCSRSNGNADTELIKSTSTVLFILPHKFQKKRLNDIKQSLTKKHITFVNTLVPSVTHIVTECANYEQFNFFLTADKLELSKDATIVSTAWLVDCLKNSKVVPILDCHRLKKDEKVTTSSSQPLHSTENFEWACQRGAKLKHFNSKFTEALELLEMHAELRNESSDQSRALAFRRASCVLKALPFTLIDVRQLNGWKDIGEHVRRVISDILDFGVSSEVEEIRHSSWFCKMKLFTDVFGVGPAISKVWIEKGWSSIEDARQGGISHKDWRITYGLAFFEDLSTPINTQEMNIFEALVQKNLRKISPSSIFTVTGGFRRGKTSGHDIDILITHPIEGEEIGILPKLLDALNKDNYILKGQIMKNSFSSDALYDDSKSNLRTHFDHFEKWLGICRFPRIIKGDIEQEQCSSGESIKGKKTDLPQQSYSTLPCHYKQLNYNTDKIRDPIHSSVDGEGKHNLERKKRKLTEDQNDTRKKCHLEDLPHGEVITWAQNDREWIARRVDLIVAPYSQYYYALIGWTGSKHFNRDARLYAQKCLGLKLTSHGLYDLKKNVSLPASSEEEIFSHLKLPYRDPMERNC